MSRQEEPSPWEVPASWLGETVILLGTGPSLPALLRQMMPLRGASRVVAINDACFLSSADILYGCDLKWWAWHDGVPAFNGIKVTQDREAAARYGLLWLPSVNKPGLSRDPRLIHQGSNSGYQAVNLAVLMGAHKVILVGFDHRDGNLPDRHYFGAHKDAGVSDFGKWNREFWPTVVHDLEDLKVDVVNCTPGSGLRVFRFGNIEDELCA